MSAGVAQRDTSYSHPQGSNALDANDPMPYLTQQYAVPIHQTGSRRASGDATAEYRSGVPRAEYALRRKTPNGTLNAGYDGSLEDGKAHKHQLLPRTEADATQFTISNPSGVKRTFRQHEKRRNASLSGWASPSGMAWPGPQYAQPITTFPVMDSMLQQIPIHQYQQYYGQTVPSVIQPSFHHLGPTASGVQGSGPYGPYWHDGTFVPYRPAALRDPRFYHLPTNHWSDALQTSRFTSPASSWQFAGTAQAQHPPGHGGALGNSQGFVHNSSGFNGNQSLSANTAGDVTPTPQNPYNIVHQNFTVQGIDFPSDDAGREIKREYQGAGLDTKREYQDVVTEYGPSSTNGQQRDKTFSWALQQYKDLLLFIQHTKRQQQAGTHIHGQSQVSQQPGFYPRPPKPTRSGSAFQVPSRRTEPELQARAGDEALSSLASRKNSAPAIHSRDSDSEIEIASRRTASLWAPSGVMFHDNNYPRRSSYEHYRRAEQVWPQPHEDRFRTLRRSSGSSVSSIVSPLPLDDSPPSRAAIALTYITKLCQETEWQWTDGMHLGGCLAYGLGHRQKALRWYTKVLDMEPNHLEATSNLAATLLALNRRSEAESHWMKVVRAAPNHFEAVEHLIGMLCNEQRSRDAIRVIDYVERMLRMSKPSDSLKATDLKSECSSSTASRSPCISELSDRISYDFDVEGEGFQLDLRDMPGSNELGFGSSGFAIPGCDNGRILALIHAKGNMLYGLNDYRGATHAFEDAVLIATGRQFPDIQGLVKRILTVVSADLQQGFPNQSDSVLLSTEPILLTPEQALTTSKLCFPHHGELPGLQFIGGAPQSLARKAIISTTSNSLLSLAKIFQDGMSNTTKAAGITPLACGVRDILALYYLSLSLQPSPSTANNVGILLASVQHSATRVPAPPKLEVLGVVPGSGIALALAYYNYGLQLDQHHAHLYTNLGSLLKDIGQLDGAISMYERAVKCDGKFDIALANLANAVKDKGRINDAIVYYKRAVDVNPDFAEAVCGLANALNSVCHWQGRGGMAQDNGRRDRWHVDPHGMLLDARQPGASGSGWIKRVVDIVEKQLIDGETWGSGALTATVIEDLVQQVTILEGCIEDMKDREASLRQTLTQWTKQKWEGARITRLIERATRRIGWHWYQDKFVRKRQRSGASYSRAQLPASLTVPTVPTVLPFHTFTCPMSAEQIRQISQRNGLRISVSTLRAPWLPKQVYPPPPPPAPFLRIGYLSSDFNNHPLAHLMQSVFGLHNDKRAMAYCYATTASDNSIHRRQIQAEAPVFRDASSWSVERLVNQIVEDKIHILVNLNGYTRGARNEVFAARPAPIQMSFMGFAGTLGAEWCDYLLADETAIPPETLRPWRRNVDIEDSLVDENNDSQNSDWVYGENIIYCRDTFFCCDHKQSAPEAKSERVGWDDELQRRWQMRKELFSQIKDDTIIFGNFNQLYKIEPTTFRTWLRILARVPNSILWLLRFPDLGESHLLATARQWAGSEVASRVVFTDVAPKHLHISRARICDMVLDTAECNAHTTAADVLWSGTPLLTLPRHPYKMCSRMAASILKGALPKTEEGSEAAKELIATSEEDYEEKAVALGKGCSYPAESQGRGHGRLMDLRKILFHARWTSALFDTKRWARDLEDAYEEAWRRWVKGEGGDIWLDQVPRGGE